MVVLGLVDFCGFDHNMRSFVLYILLLMYQLSFFLCYVLLVIEFAWLLMFMFIMDIKCLEEEFLICC